MPGVDGIFATRMIRFLEKESEHLNARDPYNAKPRVAIIAVSSHLYEEKRFDYVQCGYVHTFVSSDTSIQSLNTDLEVFSFDGWILKPIDFRRLDLILQGVKNPEIRRDCVYTPGQWERGGWFLG
jgi:hypothetical protein